jgi:hypothetical protein
MDELLAKIQAACAGLTAEEIESQIGASQYVSIIPDVSQLALFLEAIGAAGEELVDPLTEAPDQDVTEEQSGND